MKKDIHPKLFNVSAQCTCGKVYLVSTTAEAIHPSLCSNCHPFFVGNEKFVDSAGRINKFKQRYGK